jgi:hypothetical protein
MTKVSRREACSLLLRGAGLLGGASLIGCTYLGPTAPALPKDCVWVQSPGVVACLHNEEVYDESGIVVGSTTPRDIEWEELNYDFSSLNEAWARFVSGSEFPP